MCRAYRHLYWPERSPENSDLQHFELPPVDQGQAKKSQTKTVLGVLRENDKISSKPPPTDRLSKATRFSRKEEVTTKELAEVTWRDHGQQILLDASLIQEAIVAGIRNGTWVYYDADQERTWSAEDALPSVRIAGDTWLYTPDRARSLKLLRKPVTSESITAALVKHGGGEIGGVTLRAHLEETLDGEPPKKDVLGALARQAGMPDGLIVVTAPASAGASPLTPSAITHAKLDDLRVISPERAAELNILTVEKKDRKVKGTGSVGKSFQRVEDQIADLGSPAVTAVVITASADPGEGVSDLRKLGFCISQLPRWECQVDVRVTVEFEGLEGGLKAELAGNAEGYQRLEDRLLKLADAGSDVSGRLRINLTPASPLSVSGKDWKQMRSVVATNDPGRLSVEAELAR